MERGLIFEVVFVQGLCRTCTNLRSQLNRITSEIADGDCDDVETLSSILHTRDDLSRAVLLFEKITKKMPRDEKKNDVVVPLMNCAADGNVILLYFCS